MLGEGAQAHGASAKCTQALSIAVEHPALSADAGILCSAARVCKGWRQAVQQCSGCNTTVVIGPTYASHKGPTAPLRKLSSFAQWLPAHAALVKSITINTRCAQSAHSSNGQSNPITLDSFIEIAQQLMQPAMALAAAGAAAPAAPAGQFLPVQQQQQRGLRLASFTADLPGVPGMLAALPVRSLTHLDLDLWSSTAMSILAPALARLSGLQHLSLAKSLGTAAGPASCLEAVAQLSRLTHLSLAGHWSGGQQPLQQFLSRPLQLQQLQLSLDMCLPALDLTRCGQLLQLSIKTSYTFPRKLVLPRQLQQLELANNRSHGRPLADLDLQQLQDLQQLRLFVPITVRAFQDMTQLQSLQHVALGYCDLDCASEAALAWQHVPQLRELSVVNHVSSDADEGEMSTILMGVAACSALTKLQLQVCAEVVEQHVHDSDDSEDEGDHVNRTTHLPAGGMLAHLTGLQDLSLESSSLMDGDALQLTALTNLTRLVLADVGAGVGELAVNTLACSLKQLRHLDLQSCNLGSMWCLAAIAHLSQLTELRLERHSGLTRQGLALLTRLSNLQQLGADAGRFMTPRCWANFWTSVRGQRLMFY